MPSTKESAKSHPKVWKYQRSTPAGWAFSVLELLVLVPHRKSVEKWKYCITSMVLGALEKHLDSSSETGPISFQSLWFKAQGCLFLGSIDTTQKLYTNHHSANRVRDKQKLTVPHCFLTWPQNPDLFPLKSRCIVRQGYAICLDDIWLANQTCIWAETWE